MITVLKPGLFTTVQDQGRPGWQAEGVSVGGALDAASLRLANLILGNSEGAAGLECTAVGPVLRFEKAARIAVLGAPIRDLPSRRVVEMAAGEVLSLEAIERGGRTYLAVAGGLVVTLVMGSASTAVTAGFGGVDGRPLRAGDQLEIGASKIDSIPSAGRGWSLSWGWTPPVEERVVVRALEGPQHGWFDEAMRERFWGAEFQVTPKSNRMGLRLQGDPIGRSDAREMISEAVTFGSVQIPPDGHPIVLLADRQTLGGYPKIASVISADWSRLGRVMPGLRLRFERVSLQEAQYRRERWEKNLAATRAGLRQKYLLDDEAGSQL
ncbi:MAG TPA: biotin-dependent carboxyltransferase family protein [Opitutaceae bacterium]|nr:biotin-dependent carboxyltransferase family protein [Opitutaceae bacterium]